MSKSQPTPEQMAKRVARYRDLRPYKDTMNDAHGIPPEAMRMMSPDNVYPIMSPENWTGRRQVAPVKGEPGLTVSLAECSPGDTKDAVVHPAATGDEVARRFGQHTREAMAAIGVRFGD